MNQLVAAIMTIGLHFRGMFQQGLVFQLFVIPASNASQEGRKPVFQQIDLAGGEQQKGD